MTWWEDAASAEAARYAKDDRSDWMRLSGAWVRVEDVPSPSDLADEEWAR